jgi:hypothetical protein
MAQLIVIIQVLVAKRNSIDALPNQRHNLMFNQILTPGVAKASGKTIEEADGAVGRAEQTGI